MLAFGVYQIASNFKNSIQGIAGFAVMIVIFLVARATAGADSGRLETVKATFNVGPGESSFISGAITTALVMLGIAALAFVVSEIRNFFK